MSFPGPQHGAGLPPWGPSGLLLGAGKALAAAARGSVSADVCWLCRQPNFSLVLSEGP